ncbi:MAG: glycosyltransferase [Ruminococcaceae bacterium]|nr:glycosyltransferase [Oscillospiraceae bacterium]
MISQILTLASLLFFLCSGYQLLYLIIPHLPHRKKSPPPPKPARCAVLICARNEAAVLPSLIESVKAQTCRAEIFVLADNCTDGTAEAAREAGAVVWERRDASRIGKGYALSALLSHMEDAGYRFDRYFIFDADNLLAADCIEQMNRTFDEGYPIVTGCRASKNFGDNWISAGYGLFFLRESRYLNLARMRIGTSCAVSGTGFGFTREMLTEQAVSGDLWPFHLLTEDLQFTASHVLAGHSIGYAEDAVFYDEQPTDFIQSWHQRLRWSKGGLQVVKWYGKRLLVGAAAGQFACFDMLMASFPAAVYNLIAVICHALLLADGILAGDPMPGLLSALQTLGTMGGTFLLMGAATMLSERRHIRIPLRKKLRYTLTFPLFMFTYIPISLASFCCRVEWKPILHKGKDCHVQHLNL